MPNKQAAFVFSSDGATQTGNQLLTDQISQQVSIPVKLESLGSDPTLKGYETPNIAKSKSREASNEGENAFIEKTKKTKSAVENAMELLEKSPAETVEHDIKTFIKQFENSKDKADKLKGILDAKARLTKEAKDIKETISLYLGELLEAKKLAIRLNNLVHKYEKKVIDDQQARQLKLADEITIKELLKDKIHREIQGLRVATGEYNELEQANPQDIDRITKDVVAKIGPY